MGITNRDKDVSEQQAVFEGRATAFLTGQTAQLLVVPYQAQVMSAMQSVSGTSGAPLHSLWIQRFVVGSGLTSINIGATLAAANFALSGAQTFTLTSGSTNLLQAGDVIILSQAASNAAVADVVVGLSLKALQDIKTNFGT